MLHVQTILFISVFLELSCVKLVSIVNGLEAHETGAVYDAHDGHFRREGLELSMLMHRFKGEKLEIRNHRWLLI